MKMMNNRPSGHIYIETTEDEECHWDSRIEAIGLNGEVYVAVFTGSKAETEAE
jgi:hypothetical protein